MRLPIWSAYFIAPAVILAIASKVILRSDGPFALAAMCAGCGLFCAAAMHAVEARRDLDWYSARIILKNRSMGWA